MSRTILVALLSLASSAVLAAPNAPLTVTRLRWDARDRPLGLIQFEPRLSWVVSSAARGQRQTAYQVLVASDPARLRPGKADLWDSKKVVSDRSINVPYQGPSPLARQRAYWTVRVWDAGDRPSAFAAPTWWEMGLYDEEWEGQWIGRPISEPRPTGLDRSVTHLRKAFTLEKEPKRARLYASAFGVYELRLNGKRAGDEVLAPGFTDYEKRVAFQTHDVTALVRRGENVIGALVGGGWCTAGLGGVPGGCGQEPPRVIVQLEVTYADGSRQVVLSDTSWRAQGGAIASSHLQDGEVYDARRELPGWDRPGYDDSAWSAARQYDRTIERDLVAEVGPPIVVAADVRPVRVTEPVPGVAVFDLGQPLVGWARLRVRAAAGTTINLRYGARLGADGTIAAEGDRVPARGQYTARGGAWETWEPRFSLHAFRYVEVRGLSGRPAPETITGRVVHSRMPATGSLETSSPVVNALHAAIVRAQQAAFVSVPTAGTPRAERPGALLEAQLFAPTACLNADVQPFLRKWIDDVRDAQRPEAAYTAVAPDYDRRPGAPAAAAAGVLVPWALHRCYGDRTALDAHWPSMGRWLNAVATRNPDHLWSRDLGPDPADPGEVGRPTDRALLASAQLGHVAEAMAAIARQGGPGLAAEARRFDELARAARAAFARAYLGPDGKLVGDTQTAYAVALSLGALTGAARERAGAHLVAALDRQGGRPTTGLVGGAHLLPALSTIGRDDLAYRLLLRQECPSWRCTLEPGFADYATGAIGAWMYDAIGGIALDPEAPAGKHFLVRPRPGGGLTHARARFDSAHGPIITEWRREATSFRLEVVVPANSHATITLPFPGPVTEGGRPLAQAPNARVVEASPRGTVIAVDSGSYRFAVDTR